MRSHFVSALSLAGGLFLKANSWAAGGTAGWPMDLTGGDYEKGRALFFGKNPKCGGCHRLRGQGFRGFFPEPDQPSQPRPSVHAFRRLDRGRRGPTESGVFCRPHAGRTSTGRSGRNPG